MKDNTDDKIYEGDEYLIKPTGKFVEDTRSAITLNDEKNT